MTEYQEHQIWGLRMRGAGYKAIASATGLSRDIVRNYCKSHGLEGLASEFTINMKEQIDKGLACASCGRPLEQPATSATSATASGEWRMVGSRGSNRISVSHDGLNTVKMMVEGKISYETV